MTFPVLSANGPTGYKLTRSLRFRSSASAYLNRTPASATNQKTWTWSGWVKLSVNGNINSIFTTRYVATGPSATGIRFLSGNTLDVFQYTSGSLDWEVTYTPVYRDPSAWYHFVIAVDTTQATSTNRVKFYVNGVQVTATTTGSYPTQNSNTYVNSTNNHAIGTLMYGDGSITPIQGLDGYTAEVNFVDGQALTPSSFGSTNSVTGVWQPAKYTGTYGTNGFYLPFTNTTSTTTLGYDSSGNGNNWTPNNISLTAGSTYDSMTDVPTLTSATAANYAVLNPLDNILTVATITNGNLTHTGLAGNSWSRSTIKIASGKYYWETTIGTGGGSGGFAEQISIGYPSVSGIFSYNGYNGQITVNGSLATTVTTSTNGDVIGLAFDRDANTCALYKNNSLLYTATSLNSGEATPQLFTGDVNAILNINFGQRPFTYTPPSGYVALNTYNLPASTIQNGAAYMAATLYTGTLLSNSISNAVGSASFQPDLVWIKSRSAATDHKLTDVVRGVTKALISDTTGAETTDTFGLTAFNSNGFTVSTDTNYNNSGATYVAWNWKAGGTAVSNTNGSITSSVSANTTSGFSVVTYTGTGANATVGHGLGVAPSMIITKKRSSTSSWGVYHTITGNTSYLLLDTNDASVTSSTYWNNTSPTSSVFSISTADPVNINGATYVAYCFSAIKGFSAFGSYAGNGSSDGPFVYTGFRPKYVLVKCYSQANGYWTVMDSSRNPYNLTDLQLYPNGPGGSGAESQTAAQAIDLLSNGFKFRGGGNLATNYSGASYIYIAFAENPFQNALAR
jgi:hypothetical protein